MNECESCIHYPPSAADGKPCCFCDPIDSLLNCYQRKDDEPDCRSLKIWTFAATEKGEPMSSKSKRKPKYVSMHKAVSIAMTIFVWAWMSCFNPTQEDVNRMSDEVRNIRESVNSKNLNIWEVRDAIKDEFGWET